MAQTLQVQQEISTFLSTVDLVGAWVLQVPWQVITNIF